MEAYPFSASFERQKFYFGIQPGDPSSTSQGAYKETKEAEV